MTRSFATLWVLGMTLAGAAIACGDTTTTSKGTPPPPVARAAQVVDAGGPLPKLVEFTENDFVENDRDRDPFRSYASLFVEKGQRAVVNQLHVILPQYSIDELRLVAIVTGGDYPRAMLVDPTGKGWVVKRGDYLGRPDTVHTGGPNGTDYQLNWRIDRVRDGDVVLNREDRASNGIAPAATRVIPLHPEADKNAENEQRL
jgi:type IV pilus assembly protein PilP